MLKRDITYEDADGDKVTDTFYFNLTRTELIELEVSYKGGLQETLLKMIKIKDMEQLMALIKRLILMSYGERSEDGKRFVKNEQLRTNFADSFAFDALFMELATNEETVASFVKGIIPKDFAKEVEKLEAPVLSAMPPASKD